MNSGGPLDIKLRLPARLFYAGSAKKLAAQSENGSFVILPNHIDFVTALVPCVLTLTDIDGTERVFGIDEGILVKHDRLLDVCVRRATGGADLAGLRATVRDSFIDMDEQERTARSALSRMEADMVRQFAKLRDIRE